MSRYQLAHEYLPPEADVEQAEKVKRACDWDKVRFGQSAKQNLLHVWKISETQIRNAISAHIEQRRKVFKKYASESPGILLPNNLQANVSIYDGKDVYVEMILTEKVFIIVNAHEHMTIRRLPQ